jgi:parallel beta-helix repeat protein
MRRIFLAPLITALVVIPAGTAAAAGNSLTGASTTITCGQTLTTNTRVANDLVNCAGAGLVVGADNVTIDLAGHTIDGVNAAGSDGIAVDGHKGVRIENGTVRDFFVDGVALRDAPRSTVTNLRVADIGAGGGPGDASAGVLVQNSAGSAVTNTTVINDVTAFQSDGVDVLSSPHTLVSGNRLSQNAWDGIFVLESPSARVLGNQLDRNQNHGLEVNAGSDWITVCGNHAWGNGVNGLVVGASAHGTVTDNAVTSNGQSGLFFFDLIDSVVSGNEASGNFYGIVLAGGQNGSTGNRLVHNDASRNLGVGISLDVQANHNTVVANTANANQGGAGAGGGIVVLGSSSNTLVGNATSRNVAVGLGIYEDAPGDAAGNALKGNVANQNAAHGIDAVVGTTDLGGNRAHGNTPAPNCVGVSCS